MLHLINIKRHENIMSATVLVMMGQMKNLSYL